MDSAQIQIGCHFVLNCWTESAPGASLNRTLSKPRDARLDALRGLFLIIMAGVHVPTPVSHFLQDPYGCNGAAEGFIFLSACLAGRVYGKYLLESGWGKMSQRLWKRARLIYFVHLGVLIPATFIIWALAAKAPPLANHFSDFLVHPLGSLALMPLLLHQPPLFDILPLYIIFLSVTPWLLTFARRRGWGLLVFASALLWLAAQFKLDAWLMGNPTRFLPFRWGSFDLLAWQLVWMCGAAVGERSLRGPLIPPRFRTPAIFAGLTIVLGALYWRWGFHPQPAFNSNIYLWMDKWTLGPLRVLPFAGWTLFLLAWNPHPPSAWLAPTALLGRHSLGVFAFHLPLVIGATTAVQMLGLSDALQVVVGLVVISLLFPWAALLEHHERRRSRSAARHPAPKCRPSLETTGTPG